jgi:hypothetical protein
MTKDTETELDNGTKLLLHMFYRAFASTIGHFGSPAELMSGNRRLVEGSRPILEWLRLVTPDSTLPFGFRPTSRLEKIYLKRGFRPVGSGKKRFASVVDTDVLNSIFDAALVDEEHVCPLARVTLYVLGLIVYSKDGSEVPTGELRVLAAERREQDRERRKSFCPRPERVEGKSVSLCFQVRTTMSRPASSKILGSHQA